MNPPGNVVYTHPEMIHPHCGPGATTPAHIATGPNGLPSSDINGTFLKPHHFPPNHCWPDPTRQPLGHGIHGVPPGSEISRIDIGPFHFNPHDLPGGHHQPNGGEMSIQPVHNEPANDFGSGNAINGWHHFHTTANSEVNPWGHIIHTDPVSSGVQPVQVHFAGGVPPY